MGISQFPDVRTAQRLLAEPACVSVMIVDDHPVVRRGLAFSLATFDDIRLLGEAANGEDAIRLCGKLRPDVALMDMAMPGMDGVAATRAIRGRYPQTQVLVLTSFCEPDLVRSAMQAGAVGYLLKLIDIDELAQAIRSARCQKSTFAKEALAALASSPAEEHTGGEVLTKRELEVLALVVAGKSNQQIAQELFISLATARFHVSSIFGKLGAANRAEASALAVKRRLVH